MSDFRYDNSADAVQHLNYTVVKGKDGVPYYLKGMRGWKWTVQMLGSEVIESMDIREIGLTFEPIELGYCNGQDMASYLIRRPVRMWKQGLSNDHIKAQSGYILENLLTSEPLRQTIMNEYPSMIEAHKHVIHNGGSWAFHRDFAFITPDYPSVSLQYKGSVIGEVTDDGDFDINEKFFFVKEQLEEILRA